MLLIMIVLNKKNVKYQYIERGIIWKLKYSDYRLEYPDGDRLRFSKDGGWPSFNLKINTPIPDKDFYVELYTGSSGCPYWIVYTSFYEKYNLLLR